MDNIKDKRDFYIGGSDISAALGKSKFITREQFLNEKINGISAGNNNIDQIYMDFGDYAEPLMRDFMNEEFGLNLQPATNFVNWFGVEFRLNNDGQDEENKVLAEFKTNNDGKLQDHYLIQALTYALKLPFTPEIIKIGVLKRPKDFDTKENFGISEKEIKKMKIYDFTLEELKNEVDKIISSDFLKELENICGVIKRGRKLKAEFGGAFGDIDVLELLGTENEYSLYKRYKELSTRIKELSDEKAEVEKQILNGESKPYFEITPAEVKISNRFSSADFKKDNAELYAKYVKPSETNYKAKIKEIK